MRKRSIFLFLISLGVGLFHTPKSAKKVLPKVDPRFFVGTWRFKDRRGREHTIVIDPDLKLTIDEQDLSAKVSAISRYELSYIDKFGYKLEIRGNEARPVKFYDESENDTYDLMTISN
ncbi:DUF4828 domain-containing protein [Lentilactobacillus kisonensis]|uniref:DUF4828 domain-containing protein n=1 Tax=Lentilactobacillus kisonensis DSM 19906 = JCM 15041 TaxID=1423766 RepID=A0A0R1NW05_9LACO|nr:DUF4828 domain-containing protein [Lentilactobacillus kisonensis]KRL20600.1 hypothetical protein FC98_GL001381 [Lentilactobacillus kisonensis DSM 19906 = JCM 15041]